MAKSSQPVKTSQHHKTSHVVQASYSGPLPPPNILEGYEKLVPGVAEMIFRTYEQEVRHRQESEKELLRLEIDSRNAETTNTRIGQILGFIICMSFLAAGFYLITNGGYEISGTIFGGGSMAAIVTAYLVGRSKK